MRNRLIAAALIAAMAPSAALADVAPLTPEGRIILDKRNALEMHARQSFGDIGLIEKLRDWRKHWGWILVGKEGSKAAPRLLVKDEYGWYEVRPGQTKRLQPAIGLELNRLLTDGSIWSEQPYNFGSRCSEAPRLFIVMHAGQDQFGRIGCGPEGLAARAARVAETLRVPPGRGQTIAPPPSDRERPVPGASPHYWEASSKVSARLWDMAAAWDRRTFAGFVEPYAEDVVIERPDGVLRGRKAVIDWARYLQDWNAPYDQPSKGLKLHQIVSKNQDAKGVFYTTHEYRWEEAGRPVRQTYSTMWRDYNGLWLIAHERVSEVKPVTERQRR